MRSTKLIYLLKSLSTVEMRRLEQFVHSPFVNKNENVIALFTHVSKYHPEYENPRLDKQKIFAKLFPGETFRDERMRYLCSELLTLTEDFLVYLNYSNDPVEKQFRLLEELNSRKLDTLFDIRKKEVERMMEDRAVSTKSLLHYFRFEDVSRAYFQRKLMGHEDELLRNIDYPKVMRAFSRYYLGYSLRLYATMLNQGKSYRKENPFHALEEVFEALHAEMDEQPLTTQLFLACVRMLKTNDEKYYFEIKEMLLGAGFKEISPDDQKAIIPIITNFCTRKYQEGNMLFLQETNTLNKLSIDRRLFLRGEHMSHVQFSNIVMLAIHARNVDWLDDFIESYTVYLPEDVRESTTSYAKANLAYYRKDYKQALQLLRDAKYESPVRQMGIKNLLMKIYFDRDETELILPLIDSYQHSIKSSTVLTEKSKNLYRNFIRFYQALYQAKQTSDTQQMEQVRAQVKEEHEVAQRIWLLEKIDELAK